MDILHLQMDQHLIVLEVLEVQHKVVAVQETLPQLVLPKEIMQVPVEQHHNTLEVAAEELAASCQPRRHAPHAGGLLPRLFGHLLFCYTCVMSTLLCPLLAVVVRLL